MELIAVVIQSAAETRPRHVALFADHIFPLNWKVTGPSPVAARVCIGLWVCAHVCMRKGQRLCCSRMDANIIILYIYNLDCWLITKIAFYSSNSFILTASFTLSVFQFQRKKKRLLWVFPFSIFATWKSRNSQKCQKIPGSEKIKKKLSSFLAMYITALCSL